MAHRGTASSKKADANAPAFASVTAADVIRAPVTQKTIPLDLISLIVPYKKQGRLTLRVERMPQRAKLSAGRNNGDGTWSLASDELEDLNYLVPSNISGGHELSLRIMSFDNGAAHTLKVIPLAIPAWEGDADVTAAENIVRSSAESRDPILHNELSKMQSLFAVRDSDLAELRAALKQANAQKEAELAAARTVWEAELKQRLAEVAAQAKAETDKERQTWEKRQQGQAGKAEAVILEKITQELSRSKSEVEERLEAARKQWQAQVEQKIAEERDRLKAEADLQFDAERRQWQSQADQHLAEERSRLKAENDQKLETERGRWHAEVQQRIADEFCRSKTETDQQFEAERKQLQAQAEQKLAEERDRLKAETDLQFDAERKHWQTQMEQRLADERGQALAELEQKIAQERARAKTEADQRVEAERQLWQTQVNGSGEVERHRLLAEAGERLAAEQKRWLEQTEERLAAERRRLQFESDQRLESERQNWIGSGQAAMLQAEARWKSEESVRAAAALAEWQQQSARQQAVEGDKCRKLEAALAAALAQPASTPLAETDTETGRLRQELSALQSALPERDREIAQLREELNRQRERPQQDTEAAQTAAAQIWKAEEAVRTEALVAQARAQSQDAIAAATARAENAERALAEAQGAAPATDAPRWDDGYVDGLRRDISTLRAALVNREVELGHARAALDQARVHQVVARPGNAPIRRFAGPDDTPEEKPVAKPSFLRDFAIIAGVLVPLIVIYPHIAAFLPAGIQSGIATVTGGFLSAPVEPVVAPRPAPAPAPVAPRPTTSVIRAAKLRATPATTGVLLGTLPRDAAVVVLKTDGNWTQIELPAKAGATPQQGWVFSTYLKGAASNAPVKPAVASAVPKPVKPVPKLESTNTPVEPEKAQTPAAPENTSAAAEPAQ